MVLNIKKIVHCILMKIKKKKERVFTLRTKMDYFNTMGRLGEAFKIHE